MTNFTLPYNEHDHHIFINFDEPTCFICQSTEHKAINCDALDHQEINPISTEAGSLVEPSVNEDRKNSSGELSDSESNKSTSDYRSRVIQHAKMKSEILKAIRN